MYIINYIPKISPQRVWAIWSAYSFEQTIFGKDKTVFIYMNNMFLHFNDYEEKSEKKVFCYIQNINVVILKYSNLGFEDLENFIFVVTNYFCNKQCLNFSCEQFVCMFTYL